MTVTDDTIGALPKIETALEAKYEAVMAANLKKFELQLRRVVAAALWPHADRPVPHVDSAP